MTPGQYTIFGANGFVGSTIAGQLEQAGHSVGRVTRGNWPERGARLGNVIFTIGMTADFRTRLVETFELQIIRLHEALSWYSFDSFTYLSSARIYAGAQSTHEDAEIPVRPTVSDHAYNISKLAGESRCFAESNPQVRVVRLSNVYGAKDTSNLFLTAVMREALEKGSVRIGQSPQSSKDYIAVEDAARAIVLIAQKGQHRLYNVAYGQNFSHQDIAEILALRNYSVDFGKDGALASFPRIDTFRLDSEFGLRRTALPEGMNRAMQALEQKRTS